MPPPWSCTQMLPSFFDSTLAVTMTLVSATGVPLLGSAMRSVLIDSGVAGVASGVPDAASMALSGAASMVFD